MQESKEPIDDINNNDEDTKDDGEITKPKVKKVRTPAQVEAFKKTMQKRADNINMKKEEKIIQNMKFLKDRNVPIENILKEPTKPKATPKTIIQQPDDNSIEEEIIIVKSKPKKKVKKVIIEDSSSSDDSSSGSSGGNRNKYKYNNRVSIQRETKPMTINYFV